MTGNILLQGTGGATGGPCFGVALQVGGLVRTTGATGSVTIQGTGGANSGNSNSGIFINDTATAVTTGGGNITLTGVGGGTGASDGNFGLNLQAATPSATMVAAGGNGTVTIQGTGGATAGTANYGIVMIGLAVSTNNGDISMIATAGGSSILAMQLASGSITAQGAHSVTLNSPTTNHANLDVEIPVSSPSGSISVTTAGTITGGNFNTAGALFINSVLGIAVSANTVSSFSASNSGGGPITLSNTATTLALGAIAQSGSNVTITNTGSINVTNSISAPGNVTLSASGSITEMGSGLISTPFALATSSTTGTNLGGANTVANFTAANAISGAINLTNGAALSVGGITQSGPGPVNILCTALTVNGTVVAAGGAVDLQATGNVIVAASQILNCSSSNLTLAADVTAIGSGDDGIGTLTINAGASVFATSLTLRGADIDIAPTATVGSATVSSTAPSATLTGMFAPLELAFDSSGNLFVTNFNGTSVSEFAPGATTATNTLFGLNKPFALAFDANGNLFVSNQGSTTVSEFAPGGTSPIATLTGLTSPAGLAFDSSGNLYVANGNGSTVSVFAPGALTPTNTLSGVQSPLYLIFDTSGNLYVSNNGGVSGTTVSKFAPGATTPTDTLTGLVAAGGLAFDPSGNLFVTSGANGKVLKYAPGATTPSATLTGVTGPRKLAFDAVGNLYVTNQGGTTVSEFAPGATTPTTTFTGLTNPGHLVFDASGNLFVTDFGGTTVTEFAPYHLATGAVTIQSSIPSRPMQFGGSNNAAVAGVTLTSAELARIATAQGGLLTLGDAGQTGDITFTTAIPASTVGANLTVQQEINGGGKIALDTASGAGTALDGHGGALTLIAGTGGIVDAGGITQFVVDVSAIMCTLNSGGTIGTASVPLQLAVTSLSTDTSVVNANQYLYALGIVTLIPGGITAGTGYVTFSNGTFSLGGDNCIDDNTKLTVDGVNTTFSIGAFNETVDTLTIQNISTINGTTGVLTSTNAIQAIGGTCDAILGGANGLSKNFGQDVFLNAANTYSGATLINGGRLFVDAGGSIAAGSPVTVSSGTTFGTAGTAFGPVTYNAGSHGLFATATPLTVGGTLTLATAGTLPDVQVVLTSNLGPGTYPLVNYTNAGSSGAFNSVPSIIFGSLASGCTAAVTTSGGVVNLVVTPPPQPPVVAALHSDDNPSVLDETGPYNITAPAADSPTLSYTFNFGDGSPDLTGTFPQGTVVPLSHIYTSYSDTGFFVTLTVTDGTTPVTVSTTQFVPSPSSTGTGVTNIATGQPPVVEPLDGLSVAVQSSDGGVLQLAIDVSSLTRNAYGVSTDFGDVEGRSSTVTGLHPVHQFLDRGIFVAKSTATNLATNVEAGKARLTLALSSKETGDFPPNARLAKEARGTRSAPDNDPTITTKSLKGKIQFAGIKTDLVTYTGTIKLPAGLIMSNPHEFYIAIGNIVAQTAVDGKGKGVEVDTLKVLKSLKLTTKVKKGTMTVGGEIATVTVTYSTKNLYANGYDTEGISPLSVIPKGKSVTRMIQIAMLLDGYPYQVLAPVDFKLSSGSDFGNFSGRR